MPRNRDSGGFDGDSLDLIEQVLAFEEEFDITIPDDDAEKIHSLQDAIRYLDERRRQP